MNVRATASMMAIAGATLLATSAGAIAAPSAADAIAQKFADPGKPVAAKPATATSPAAPATKPAAPKLSAPARPDLDYEMDMLRRARLDETNRKAAPASLGQPSQPPSVVPSTTPPAPKLADTTPSTAEPDKAATPSAPPQATAPPAPAPQRTDVAPFALPAAPRATVLIALDSSGRGARATPDPVLCIGDVCYLSKGFAAAALPIAKRDALAVKSTVDHAADACRGQFGCVYRGVAIPDGAQVLIVDLTSTGEPAGAFSIAPDASCKIEDGDVYCAEGLVTSAYRLWAIPEAIAERAGVEALDAALDDGLHSDDVAHANDK